MIDATPRTLPTYRPKVGNQPVKRPLRYEIGEWCVRLKEHLPLGLKSACVDLFVRHAPIWLIRLLWKELAGYFKLRTPRRGDVVVDAGAWTGHFTIVAARLVGSQGGVIAIEPQKVMCERLRRRLDRLGLWNVKVVESALFDSISVIAAPRGTSSGFNVFEQACDTDDSETVTLRTLDDILTTLGADRINFIKMDIEGAELEALAGMRVTLSSRHPFLAVASYHMREGATTSSRVEQILTSAGYSARTGHPSHLTTWGWDDTERRL
jgi:FkbM family methyltransferase